MDNINVKHKQMNVQLTNNEIDLLYFDLVDYVKDKCDVDYLLDLTDENKQEYETELKLIKKFQDI